MGEVVEFSPRPLGGDWSANERGLLVLLTQQLATSYGPIDGIFGQTDSGDPWYVITDFNQDVIVHIARIDGQFVVHDAAIDVFHQVGSLWGALRHVMSAGAQDQGGVVVAFNPSSREAQSFLSLVIAFGLYLELRGMDLGEGGRLNFDTLPRVNDASVEAIAAKLIAALDVDAAHNQSHAAPAASAGGAAPDGTVKPEGGKAIVVAAAAEGLPGLDGFKVAHAEAPPRPLPGSGSAPATEEAPPSTDDLGGQGFVAGARYVMAGTSGADVLFGTPYGDSIRGGDGDDYINGGGAAAGQIDRIDGGAGADHIVMSARTVANGGAGADTFVISAEPPADKGEALLGVVLDYSAANGDQLAVAGKGPVTVVSTASVSDVLAAQGEALGEKTAALVTDVASAVAGARVGFDLDGDGREDVFILLGGAGAATFKVGTLIAVDPLGGQPDPSVPLVGHPPSDPSHAGGPTTVN